MYYLIFCVFAILIMSAIIGFRRGLFKTLFGFLAVIIAIAVTYFAAPYVGEYIIKNTKIDDRIEARIYTKLEANIHKQIANSFKNAGVTKDLDELTKEETKRILSENPDKATQIKMIDGFNVPETLKKSFIDNNNDEMYEMLGTDSFYKFVAAYSTRLIINVMAFLTTFIVIRLVLLLISIIGNIIMESVPVLSGINRVSGMLLGLLMGVVLVWIFMIIASLVFGADFDRMINGNVILEKINEYNLIARVILNI